MNALGRHALAEFGGCPAHLIQNPGIIEELLVDAAKQSNATVVESVSDKFGANGAVGMVIIAESHLAAYTWPNKGTVAVDVFTCGNTIDPLIIVSILQKKLEAKFITLRQVLRGDSKEIEQSCIDKAQVA